MSKSLMITHVDFKLVFLHLTPIMLVLFSMSITIMDLTTLRIASINCKNVKSSLAEIESLCCKCDIVFIQETWLAPTEITILKALHPDFCADGTSAFRDDVNLVGRPHGGLAVLWRKYLSHVLTVKRYDCDNRILGVNISNTNGDYLFLNLYLPCDNGSHSDDNFDSFMQTIGYAVSVIDDHPSPVSFLLGDFNAAINRPSIFGHELKQVCNDNQLMLSDEIFLSPDSFTFFSEAHHTTSWLDHCVSTPLAHQRIADMSIDYNFQSSDHFPLLLNVCIPSLSPSRSVSTAHNLAPPSTGTSWSKAEKSDIESFRDCSERELRNIDIPTNITLCRDTSCTSAAHRSEIDSFYQSITDALLLAANHCIPSTGRQHRGQRIPGWNDLVKELHSRARSSFLTWARCGKPRHGPHHQEMTQDRARFKYALRACKKNEATIKADKLATDLLDKDFLQFWRDVKHQSSNKVPLPDSVAGHSSPDDIANMWACHFRYLFNSVPSSDAKQFVLSSISDACSAADASDVAGCLFTPQDVKRAISLLKKGKAAGPDSISAEHLCYAHPSLVVLLTFCFNASLIHGYIPKSITMSAISPVIKDKAGDSSDKSNYRPIALTSVITKVIERIILHKFSDYFISSAHQFGFKAGLSTDICIYTLKEIVDFYLSSSSPVYICFMDASKAFDKVCHWTLFKKLIERGLPALITRLLIYWYSSQTVYIRWANSTSFHFEVSNGVRQGGVLSPVLFNVYMDGLSSVLANSFIGCSISNLLYNHLFYADDIVLLSPSAKGLQSLIDQCVLYADSHNITFNAKKTVYSSFIPSKRELSSTHSLFLSGCQLNRSSCTKYLGVFISDDFSDDCDINRQMRGFYIRCNYLVRHFKHCSESVKCLLFSSFCVNLYAGPCWTYFKRSDP